MSKPRRKVSKPRAETKLATRGALIAAGIEEFAAHGFEASLDAICERADLTRGAFYVHFADREAFIVAVMEHVLGTFVAALTGGTAPAIATTMRLFLAAARAGSPMIRGGVGLRFHHLLEACRRSKVIGTTYRGIMMSARDQLAAGIARDRRAGTIATTLEPAALADVMMVTALGVIAATELELPVDLASVEQVMLGVLAA